MFVSVDCDTKQQRNSKMMPNKKQKDFEAHAAWIEWSLMSKRRRHDLEDPYLDPVIQEHMTVSAASFQHAAQQQRERLRQQHRQLQYMLLLQQQHEQQKHQQQQRQQQRDFFYSGAGSHSHHPLKVTPQRSVEASPRIAKIRRLDENGWAKLHVLTGSIHHTSKYAR